MKVILLERIEKLGQMGDVVKVRPGYARNYLLPQRKVLRATKESLSRFQQQRTQLEAVNLKLCDEALSVAARMEGLALFVVRQAGESGQLYGSVSARDIADAVTAAGFTVQRNQVSLTHAIKTLGATPVRVLLHPEVVVTVTMTVVRSIEEVVVRPKSEPAVPESIAEEEEEEDKG
ncbi:MAG: large subunit ribosomal protein L9 [Rhodospirillaceae bacterium]|nr:MAG: large subunit ribosomal protein L9 [Rhodospirillaceae bacterium]